MRTRIAALLGASAAIIACQAPPISEMTDKDIEAIRESTDAWTQAMESRDFAAAAGLFTVDAVVMPPNQAAIKGRDAIRAWYEVGPRVSDINLEILEVDGHANLAFVRGRYSMTITPEGAPEPISDTGKYVEIRHRVADGSWLITVDMFSSNLPIPN